MQVYGWSTEDEAKKHVKVLEKIDTPEARAAIYEKVSEIDSLQLHKRRELLQNEVLSELQGRLEQSDAGDIYVTRVVVRALNTDPSIEAAIREESQGHLSQVADISGFEIHDPTDSPLASDLAAAFAALVRFAWILLPALSNVWFPLISVSMAAWNLMPAISAPVKSCRT